MTLLLDDITALINKTDKRMTMLCVGSTIAIITVGAIFTMATSSSPPNNNNISSHVLDIVNGKPAANINCTSYIWDEVANKWNELATTTTNSAGRVPIVHPGVELISGIYKIQFTTKPYFDALNQPTFYPYIEVVFEVDDPTQHYHIPLTLSTFGYSTYKGT